MKVYYSRVSTEEQNEERQLQNIKGFDYNSNMKVLKVTQNRAIRWKSYYWVYLTAALKGKYVDIEDLGNKIWKVFYRDVFWGYFNESELRNKKNH